MLRGATTKTTTLAALHLVALLTSSHRTPRGRVFPFSFSVLSLPVEIVHTSNAVGAGKKKRLED